MDEWRQMPDAEKVRYIASASAEDEIEAQPPNFREFLARGEDVDGQRKGHELAMKRKAVQVSLKAMKSHPSWSGGH